MSSNDPKVITTKVAANSAIKNSTIPSIENGNVPDAFYHQHPLYFECTQCGQCCTGKGSYVFINKSEVENMRLLVGVTRSLFKKQYLDKHPEGDLVLAQRTNGDCVFLDDKMGCRVYKNRPVQCGTYPFWPEILASKQTWLLEADQCEGINQGKEISRQTIEHTLNLLREE